MEEGKKCCGVLGNLWHRKSELLGGLLIVLAAIATLLSFSGLGLFGMFLAGIALISKHHWKCPCCCSQSCCRESCSTDKSAMCCDEPPVKKTKAKKND
ncbi:MAG: hypothetical protein EBY16_03350 [Gammaproteobacteria bacterium]|nr:hypothetical protein [Gammaproteobacteria bacterium]